MYRLVKLLKNLLIHSGSKKLELFTIVGRTKHEVFLEAGLLDREGLEAVGQGGRTELLLPLGEVGTSNGRHGVALLPFSQVVGLRRGIETHHLGLEREDILGDERCLQVELRDHIVLREQFGLIHIAAA